MSSTTSADPDPIPSWTVVDPDLLLRSEVDGREFGAHKFLLVYAFQGFDDMLSGTPLLGAGGAQEQKDGLPVVPVPESSIVLEKILQLIYPFEAPNLRLIPRDVLVGICVALDKYCVKTFPRPVVDGLLRWATVEAELTYIRACRFRLPEVAVAALKASLRSPKLFIKVPPTELILSAQQYHAFVTYQIECREQATAVISDLAWMRKQQPLPPGFNRGVQSGDAGGDVQAI
ncbi:unnamed protein product [Peniophora sp. CBMAI 1063]|nr:unnamed protein product [Peniophora sp. CBMAI 1063]